MLEGGHLVINGQEIFPDVPLLVHLGRMLVPIRIVAETLGAQVAWDQETRTAVVQGAASQILLPIGQTQATVDGEPVTLDAPAVLYMDRTLVPLRFVAEALGCEVGWDEAMRTASVRVQAGRVLDVGLSVEQGSAVLKVATDIQLPYSVKTLDGPPRLIVDVIAATPATTWSEKPVGAAMVKGIRIGSASVPSQVTRVVCDLDEAVRFKHYPSTDGPGVVVEINYKVTGLVWENGGLTVCGSGPLECETFSLADPYRFVIDLQDATLQASGVQGIDVGAPDVVRVRIAQFQANPDVVRVVLDLTSPAEFSIAQADCGLRVLPGLAGEPVCGLEYKGTAGGGRFFASCVGGQPPPVSVTPDGRLLQLELPGFEVDGHVGGEVKDGVVDSYAVQARTAGGALLTIALAAYGGHELTYDEARDSVTLEIERSVLIGRKICIDPGHGGVDPGCISYSGVYESTVNWAIAQAVKTRLQRAGAEVKLTRGENTSINAYGRVDVANGWGAEVFVSVHCNAHYQPDKSGTEIWHYGNSAASLRLATLISTSLRGLGLVDRGVREGNYAVLRETVMPAVLVETGFLTNPGDEAVLLNPSSQARIADMICQALVAYFR